jgi:hypothetical protein
VTASGTNVTGPKLGDIVVYVAAPIPGESQIWRDRRDSGTQFLVVAVLHGEPWMHDGAEPTISLYPVGAAWGDRFYTRSSDLRVVRRASYEDVAS